MHGYLRLLLSDASYGSLTNNFLFMRPQNSGTSAAGGVGPHIQKAKDVWKDLTSTFQVYLATEQALIAQVVKIVNTPIYL